MAVSSERGVTNHSLPCLPLQEVVRLVGARKQRCPLAVGVGVDLATVRFEAVGVGPDTHLLDEGRVLVAARLRRFLVDTGRTVKQGVD